MTIYKKNGKFYSRFKIHGEQRHFLCQGAMTHSEAQAIEDAEKFKLRQQQAGLIKKENKVKLGMLIQLYDKHAKVNNLSYGKTAFCKIIGGYFGLNRNVDSIKTTDIEDFKSYLKEIRKNSPSTINKYLVALGKMYNLGIANGIININPVKTVKKLREENHKIRFLTKEEENRLFMAIEEDSPHLKPLVICALQTGMRRGEIFNLKWENIDFEYGYIELLKTKSGKPRKIPISETLMSILNNQPKISEYVFVNSETNNPFVDIKHSFSSALKKANIKNFRFHDLRHTVATRLVEKGIDLVVVKEILGHSKIDTTMRYAHAVPKRKLDAICVLNDY